MTNDLERDDELQLEARLRAHYRDVEPGAATPGWEARVDRALEAHAPVRQRWQPVLAAAAVVALAIGLLGGIRLLTLQSTAATASPTSPTSSSAGLAPSASLAPSATPNASGQPIKPIPVPTPTLSPVEVAASVDQAGTFPGGLWAVRGSQFLVSTDAGAHWTVGTSPVRSGSTARWPVITMTDATHAWAVTAAPGASEVGAQTDVLHLVASRSTDGGRTWTSTNLPGNWPEASTSLAFPDPQHGFILVLRTRMSLFADGAVFATQDGGKTWSIVSRQNTWARGGVNDWLGNEFAASDANTLWAGANPEAGPVTHPVLAVSRDGGRTWRDAVLPGLSQAVGGTVYGGTQVWASAPVFTNATDGWITVSANDQNGNPIALVYRTTDGGQTWTQPATGTGQPSGPIAILSGSHLLMPVDNLPGSGMMESTDGGATWTAIQMPTAPWFVWIAALDATHIAATTPVGNSYPDRVVLLLSSDAGHTWAPATLPAR